MECIDEAYQIVAIMGVIPNEKAKIVAYQLKGVTKLWYEQEAEERGDKVGPITWEVFKGALWTSSFDWS